MAAVLSEKFACKFVFRRAARSQRALRFFLERPFGFASEAVGRLARQAPQFREFQASRRFARPSGGSKMKRFAHLPRADLIRTTFPPPSRPCSPSRQRPQLSGLLRQPSCLTFGPVFMPPFDYQPRTRIVFGAGKLESLGELASELGARRALVVSDPGVVAAGHSAKGIAALERAGIETHLFDGVHENPTTEDVAAGVKLARRYDPEVLIGLGGGSSMSTLR